MKKMLSIALLVLCLIGCQKQQISNSKDEFSPNRDDSLVVYADSVLARHICLNISANPEIGYISDKKVVIKNDSVYYCKIKAVIANNFGGTEQTPYFPFVACKYEDGVHVMFWTSDYRMTEGLEYLNSQVKAKRDASESFVPRSENNTTSLRNMYLAMMFAGKEL